MPPACASSPSQIALSGEWRPSASIVVHCCSLHGVADPHPTRADRTGNLLVEAVRDVGGIDAKEGREEIYLDCLLSPLAAGGGGRCPEYSVRGTDTLPARRGSIPCTPPADTFAPLQQAAARRIPTRKHLPYALLLLLTAPNIAVEVATPAAEL